MDVTLRAWREAVPFRLSALACGAGRNLVRKLRYGRVVECSGPCKAAESLGIPWVRIPLSELTGTPAACRSRKG